MARLVAFATSLLLAAPAVAQPRQDDATAPDPPPAAPATPDAADLEALREENEDLRDEIEVLREDLDYLDEQVKALLPVKARLSGYLDVGFFWVDGDGSGLRSDFGHVAFPEYSDVPQSWVFMGDPLSTMINGRGDPAETAESRAIVFDAVGNQGAASFIVNSLNVQLFTGIGDSASVHSSFDLAPRSRDVSDADGLFLGDFLDVKLAYLTYRPPVDAVALEVQVGKFDSVVGREYRVSESPDRTTVAPSLICRYLCGRPVGVKARARVAGDRLVANVSVTNGSHFWEGFTFADEVDSNDTPTVAGRLSYDLPIPGVDTLELGVSGAIGAQDAHTDNDLLQWHIGGDLLVKVADLEFTAEFVRGKAEGASSTTPECDVAACLDYDGAYGLVAYRISNNLIPYARVDWRDALHRAGASFVYVSKLWRATAGLRVEVGEHLIFKADYTVNRELGRIPQFANDLFTSAMIVTY